MKWENLARQLTEVPTGTGRCLFAAFHSLDDGTCLGKYPKDSPPVKTEEILELKRAFKDPTLLYSSNITLRDIKFTYVKVEGNALLGRTSQLACIVMQTDDAIIVCIYPGEEQSKYVFNNCVNVWEKSKEM
ncbi:uncharacterized protein LOC118188519 [Stegodyphus dumicola]|uniref:uncharacterized protein LOC118188519 n=1 Tax=Stegodyphus dumicola TaxID=202533 RepID=UPI0015A873BB|nr:uncharacterized protein LOC118188519 [Stegodyphus dumicola]XP_035214847.1 uncharacterized protein LOC118188519 [Stegodyphus dumicola]